MRKFKWECNIATLAKKVFQLEDLELLKRKLTTLTLPSHAWPQSRFLMKQRRMGKHAKKDVTPYVYEKRFQHILIRAFFFR